MIEKEALITIDKGAAKDKRSRSNFLEIAGVERAKKLGVDDAR